MKTNNGCSPVTEAELELLRTLSRVVGQSLPLERLRPAQRAMAKRMRAKGLLSKRHPLWVTMTEKGKRTTRL